MGTNTENKVNFTPDTPDTCVPTSGIVCTYCKNKHICNNQVPEKVYTKGDFVNTSYDGEKKKIKKADNLFDD